MFVTILDADSAPAAVGLGIVATIAGARQSMEAGLRWQHRQFDREGYDGHNRRSGITSMHRLSQRRRRRFLRQMTRSWLLSYRELPWQPATPLALPAIPREEAECPVRAVAA